MTNKMELTQVQQQIIVDALRVAGNKYRQNAKDASIFGPALTAQVREQFERQAEECDLMVAIIAQADDIILTRNQDLFAEVEQT